MKVKNNLIDFIGLKIHILPYIYSLRMRLLLRQHEKKWHGG